MSLFLCLGRVWDGALEELGFDAVGIAGPVLPALHRDALAAWLADGREGSMEYMAREPKRRSDARASLASAKSVISLALNYYHAEDPRPDGEAGKIAKYAYGRDYHVVISKKLKKLSRFIASEAGEGTEVKSYVDTGPMLEKAFAQQAGIGFFGKNTNLITRHHGSWVFLASLITDLELEHDAPHAGSCGSCTLCLDACPTSALTAPYVLDARRCIAYLTIEAKEPVPPALEARMGEWVFGCDICQDVCPYNSRAKQASDPDLGARRAGTWVDLQNFKLPEGSPLKRSKHPALRPQNGKRGTVAI